MQAWALVNPNIPGIYEWKDVPITDDVLSNSDGLAPILQPAIWDTHAGIMVRQTNKKPNKQTTVSLLQHFKMTMKMWPKGWTEEPGYVESIIMPNSPPTISGIHLADSSDQTAPPLRLEIVY